MVKKMDLRILSSNYLFLQGDNCSAVLEQYNSDHRLFGLLRQFSLLRSKQLSPFDRSVIGIATNKPYSIRVRIWGKYFGLIGMLLIIFIKLL